MLLPETAAGARDLPQTTSRPGRRMSRDGRRHGQRRAVCRRSRRKILLGRGVFRRQLASSVHRVYYVRFIGRPPSHTRNNLAEIAAVLKKLLTSSTIGRFIRSKDHGLQSSLSLLNVVT